MDSSEARHRLPIYATFVDENNGNPPQSKISLPLNEYGVISSKPWALPGVSDAQPASRRHGRRTIIDEESNSGTAAAVLADSQ